MRGEDVAALRRCAFLKSTREIAMDIDGRMWRPLCSAGLLVGTVLAAVSVTPSLLPRSAVMQGVVAGVSFTVGYAIAAIGNSLWHYLELPVPGPRRLRICRIVAGLVCLIVGFAFFRLASEWQNSIRIRMDLEPVEGTRPFTVGLIAVLVFSVLLVGARLFRLTCGRVGSRLSRFTPRRVSYVVGIVTATALFWALIDGLFFRYLVHVADESFRQLDALVEPEFEEPRQPLKTGSPQSLVAWDTLGRAGRKHVASGTTAADLRAFFGKELPEPVRVYVGLNSAETVGERASLALAELQRVHAFDRAVLLIVTPTGTGWVDPGAIDTVEYLHRGDIASVAVQYSYLASAISLLVEPGEGVETAQAVFDKVYGYWTEMPHERRPRLYLHGLSLGALNSDRSFSIYDVVGDPFHGALWSGPPFRSETWRAATRERVPGSPAWLPRVRDSTVIRFTDQQADLDMHGVPWGPMRIAFLQYATDPITFFEPRMAWRVPEWLQPPRSPDVTPALRWIPAVTMLQVAADMRAGDITPTGHGHNYAPEDYIDSWIGLTEPAGWSEADTRRLKALFAQRGRQ
jgi:uncharacterized membrane protein